MRLVNSKQLFDGQGPLDTKQRSIIKLYGILIEIQKWWKPKTTYLWQHLIYNFWTAVSSRVKHSGHNLEVSYS